MTLYKVLDTGGRAMHGGTAQWHLPKGKRPGKWMPPVKGAIVPCQNGYHLTDRDHLIEWLGPTIYTAEGRGDSVAQPDKTAFREARLLARLDTWNDATARLFAADCAEHVLPLFEAKCPGDDRPRKAIEAARQFVQGEVSSAAWSAAESAASSAARSAASSAAWSAAESAAWSAARSAARSAAWSAAWSAAAGSAEHIWQTARLFDYLEGRAT